MDALIEMVVERPYVLAFLASFIVIAWAERGWQRMLFWVVSGTFLGWLMEFTSVRTGFPFGFYDYHEAIFPDELFIGSIPFFASLSFAFLTYFGYSIARTFLSPLERRGGDVQRVPSARLDGSIAVLLLAAFIITWVDTVTDPVAHLGRYWFLGDLYAYEGNGFHLDVPLSNYAGWVFTSLCIVFANQRFDGWLSSRGVSASGFWLPLKPFWALGSLLGNMAFMVAVSTYLVSSGGVPSSVHAGQVLVSTLVLSGLFLLFSAFMVRRAMAGRTLARTEALREAGPASSVPS